MPKRMTAYLNPYQKGLCHTCTHYHNGICHARTVAGRHIVPAAQNPVCTKSGIAPKRETNDTKAGKYSCNGDNGRRKAKKGIQTITSYLPEKTVALLDVIAIATGDSRSGIMRSILEHYATLKKEKLQAAGKWPQIDLEDFDHDE